MSVSWPARGSALHTPQSGPGTSGRGAPVCSAHASQPGRQGMRYLGRAVSRSHAQRSAAPAPACAGATPAAPSAVAAVHKHGQPAGEYEDGLHPPLAVSAHARHGPHEAHHPSPAAPVASGPRGQPRRAPSRWQGQRQGQRQRQLLRRQSSAPGRAGEAADTLTARGLGDSGAADARRSSAGGGAAMGRRGFLSAAAAAAVAGLSSLVLPGAGVASQLTPAQCRAAYAPFLVSPDYSGPGPLSVARLPRREHTCAACFPACVNASCNMRLEVLYPKGGRDLGLGPPFPLAVFSAGFLLGSAAYTSWAERLASWGYTVILYDRTESVSSMLDDAACVRLLGGLLDWAEADPLMRRLADTRAGVYLVGHSRGGKLAALAGAEDPRVAALCLIDPVDNTVYAPLAPGFPSALAALRNLPRERPLPMALVGGGLGGDCAPRQANYRRFFAASMAPSWEVAIPDAGHFQFLDSLSGLQRAICPVGPADEGAVRAVGQAVMVAWAEAMIRHRGADIFELPQPYPAACDAPPLPAPDPQAAQLAALMRRQGLRGGASLAQAALAAAAVADADADTDVVYGAGYGGGYDAVGSGTGVVASADGLEIAGRRRDEGGGCDPDRGSSGGGAGERRVGAAAMAAPQEATLTLPPPAAAASSRLGPAEDRREPPAASGPSSAASAASPPPAQSDGPAGRSAPAGGTGGSAAAGRRRALVAQGALRQGLERLVTRLRYSTGLGLEARYKGFDADGEEGG